MCLFSSKWRKLKIAWITIKKEKNALYFLNKRTESKSIKLIPDNSIACKTNRLIGCFLCGCYYVQALRQIHTKNISSIHRNFNGRFSNFLWPFWLWKLGLVILNFGVDQQERNSTRASKSKSLPHTHTHISTHRKILAFEMRGGVFYHIE